MADAPFPGRRRLGGIDRPGPVGSAADDLIAAFAAWSAGQRADEAATARSRERWLRQQQAEAATLAGVLVDLAERAAAVTVAAGGHTVTGQVAGVGSDAAVLTDRSGHWVVVATAHLTSVSTAGPIRPAGDRDPSEGGGWRLRDVLDAFGAERLPVRIGPAGAAPVAGELTAVGDDVCLLRAAGASTLYLPVHAVATVAGL